MLKFIIDDVKKAIKQDATARRSLAKKHNYGGKLENYDDLIVELETPPRNQTKGARLKGGK